MSTAWRKRTDLRLLHFEDFGAHYARTLREWRRRFHARFSEVEAKGETNEYSPEELQAIRQKLKNLGYL